jgi:hypothetical protein
MIEPIYIALLSSLSCIIFLQANLSILHGVGFFRLIPERFTQKSLTR